ncbi:GNAT family N-acetyltransferase [Clostridium botulinum]|uniref:GNAT family N-acetyltransferase n=1 Tax=Clostridium botulinum TaxID=1491 RepID=UPI001C9B0CC8|nr:GNAT family N-acetyltransferase [Clostridium botulinum]MBY6809339.1 GNAT family N-acetyltransferase [Clostridium botulinum]MBY6822781.1 GNAT family N-acetyltransferase [Clostridium botulinum]MBY6833393.1 GNAT family N-acetyltransferase [Clostridium botulinum]MBY6971454.1 GNAT family N-acetyltransferase [Clostridium botulinum]
MEVRVLKDISEENINNLIEWSNSKGQDFLQQWAGKEFSHPLTKAEINNIRNSVYSIFKGNEFVGIIQKIRKEGSNVHMGRFVINPNLTGKGIGKNALKEFCSLMFLNKEIFSISLNVFDFNEGAIKLYLRSGFKIIETVSDSNTKKYKMILER